jgi:hypothetical protein
VDACLVVFVVFAYNGEPTQQTENERVAITASTDLPVVTFMTSWFKKLMDRANTTQSGECCKLQA